MSVFSDPEKIKSKFERVEKESNNTSSLAQLYITQSKVWVRTEECKSRRSRIWITVSMKQHLPLHLESGMARQFSSKQTEKTSVLTEGEWGPSNDNALANTEQEYQSWLGHSEKSMWSQGKVGQAWVPRHFSCDRLFATPWTVAHQAPLSTGFSWQAYWSGLPCPPPGDWTCTSCVSCIAGGFFIHWDTWEEGRHEAWNSHQQDENKETGTLVCLK